ncbi:Gti1/Pac2 family transcription factor, partial [Tremellales sp. Uapishka_1]
MYHSSSTQLPAAICALKSPADAIHILEAVRLGLVPRVTRRLTGHERAMIRPGTVWVWEEEETNMRRWTDGRRWGASRVGGGGFLVYTESSEGVSPPNSRQDSPAGSFPSPASTSNHLNGYFAGGMPPPAPSNSRVSESLIKQTYSTSMTHPITNKLKKFHVVAYSSKHNPQGDAHNPLPLPTQLPDLANLKITPGIWPDWESRREDAGRRPTSYPPSQTLSPVTATRSPQTHMQGLPQHYNGLPPRGASPPRQLAPRHYNSESPHLPNPSDPRSVYQYSNLPPPHDPYSSRQHQPLHPNLPHYSSHRAHSSLHANGPYQRAPDHVGHLAQQGEAARGYPNGVPMPPARPPTFIDRHDSRTGDPQRSPPQMADRKREYPTEPPRHRPLSRQEYGAAPLTPVSSGSSTHLAPHPTDPPNSGRSPKMSIASSLLNSGSSTGVKLPPLRMSKEDERPLEEVPKSGQQDPQEQVSQTSPKKDGRKSWGEDNRQLGELGKRVML